MVVSGPIIFMHPLGSTILLLSLAATLIGQEVEPAPSPLAIRQQHVQRLMDEVERKFMSLKLALAQTDPQRAERLQEALNQTKEMFIQQRMADVTRLLGQAQLDAAGESQKALLADIRTLLEVLIAETSGQDSLKEALEQLAKWKRDIQRLLDAERGLQQQVNALPADAATTDFNNLARSQAELARQSGALGNEVGKQGPAGSEPPPGQQPLAAARQAMQQAAQDLTEQKPASASRNQGDAIQQLLAALKEVEQRASQLAQQEQGEMLSRLATHFRQMLDEQRQLTSRTVALDAKRQAAGGQLARGDRLAIRAIGELERSLEPLAADSEKPEPGLAGKAQQALDMLADDAPTVLQSVIGQLKVDLILVGGRLADELKTDNETTALQAEIETTLEQLSEALQQAQQSQAGDQSGDASDAASGQRAKQALLPTSAELKLLRAGQLQINRRTAAIDEARQRMGSLDKSMQRETDHLAQRQAALAALAAEISSKQSN